MKKTKRLIKRYSITNAAVGMQYAMMPIFLDRKGQFVENCRKLYIPGTPLNISLDLPEGVTIRAENPPIEIKFTPVKTIISQTKFFSLNDFKKLTNQFYTNLQDFYINCKFEFIGAVIFADCIAKDKPLIDLSTILPYFSKEFKTYAGDLNDIKVTFIKNKLRYHLQCTIKDNKKGLYTIALDTQIISNITFKEIISIIDNSEAEFSKVMKNIEVVSNA